MTLSESLGERDIIRLKVTCTDQDQEPYSAATQRYGWQGYLYRISKITDVYAEYFDGATLGSEIIVDAARLVRLMTANDASVSTLAQVLVVVDSITAKIHRLITSLHNPENSNKARIHCLAMVLAEIDSVLDLVDIEERRQTVQAQRLAAAKREAELLAMIPVIVSTYLNLPQHQTDEAIHIRYNQTTEEDDLILTIAPNEKYPDIVRRKITVVGLDSQKSVDNKMVFSSANFTAKQLSVQRIH